MADAAVLSTITTTDLQTAAAEEAAGQRVASAAVRLLKQKVHATASRVMGSDASRVSLRSQIWSTSAWLNPVNVWLTINPDDLHDPVAQIFVGEQIDMDAFLRTAGPDGEQRAQNIAADPFAAAKFFHFMVRTVLETLFKIKVSPFQVKTESGAKLPASYRSGRFEEWSRKMRVSVPRVGERELEGKGRGRGGVAGGGGGAGGRKFKHSKVTPAKPLDKLSKDYERKVRQLGKKTQGGAGGYDGDGGNEGAPRTQHSKDIVKQGLNSKKSRYAGKSVGRVKSELKSAEQIRKAREVAERKRAKNARASRKGVKGKGKAKGRR